MIFLFTTPGNRNWLLYCLLFLLFINKKKNSEIKKFKRGEKREGMKVDETPPSPSPHLSQSISDAFSILH